MSNDELIKYISARLDRLEAKIDAVIPEVAAARADAKAQAKIWATVIGGGLSLIAAVAVALITSHA